MKAPDAWNPGTEEGSWFELPDPVVPSLSVHPPDDNDELGPELLGPDGEVIVRRRVHPIGYHEENGRGH